jgi:hypothetical protein
MLSKYDFQPLEVKNLVRRGQKNGDGGYLIPRDIKADLLISFGLGDNWKFELDLIKHGHVKNSIIFDHSQYTYKYVRDTLSRLLPRRFRFKLLLGRIIVLIRYLRDFKILKMKHIQKKITKLGSIKGKNITDKEINLYQVFESYTTYKDLFVILKIDIEGDEYEVIDQILDFYPRIKLIIIEFHNIHSRTYEFENCIKKLKMKYKLIHTHYNNNGRVINDIPDVVEITFLISSENFTVTKVRKLPRSMDRPNNSLLKDFEITYDKR